MREPDEHVTTNLTIEPRGSATRRRRLIVVAAVGVTAAMGAGLLATQNSDAEYPEQAAQNGAAAPTTLAPAVSAQTPATPGASGSAPVASPPPTKAAPSPTRLRTPKPAVTSYRAGAETPEPRVVAADVPVREQTSRKGNSTLKVVSANGDLSYQREMLWRADDGTAVGQVRCTNNIKVNFNSPAKVRPTMLLCWRLSAERSAYTLAVDPDGKPVQAESVTALNKAWAALG